MKSSKLLAAILSTAVLVIMSGCGTGDKIGSVSISAVGASGGVINLAGLGGTLQLQVTANYTSGKLIDETNFATFTVTPEGTDDTDTPLAAPPLTLTINKTGMITAVDPAVCVWENLGTVAQPSWFYTGDYKIVATYRGFSSNPIFIPVASAAANTGNGQCGPVATGG